MNQAKYGDTVKVHYTETLESGRVIATSKDSQPLKITIGRNIVPVFEEGVVGMEIGTKKTIKIPPEQAYGTRRKELILHLRRSDLPGHIMPDVGKRVKLRQRGAKNINAVITNIHADTVTLDANHPLAGKKLILDLELVDIN